MLQRTSDWARVGEWEREWLIVEHDADRIVDMGFVDTRRLIPLYGPGTPVLDEESRPRGRREWRDQERGISGAVVLLKADFDEEGQPKAPISVDMPDGSRQRWHFGEHAYAKARETGLLVSWDPRFMVEVEAIEARCE